jgi:hypothetical protein
MYSVMLRRAVVIRAADGSGANPLASLAVLSAILTRGTLEMHSRTIARALNLLSKVLRSHSVLDFYLYNESLSQLSRVGQQDGHGNGARKHRRSALAHINWLEYVDLLCAVPDRVANVTAGSGQDQNMWHEWVDHRQKVVVP